MFGTVVGDSIQGLAVHFALILGCHFHSVDLEIGKWVPIRWDVWTCTFSAFSNESSLHYLQGIVILLLLGMVFVWIEEEITIYDVLVENGEEGIYISIH